MTMKQFIREYGELPRNKFSADQAKMLFRKLFGEGTNTGPAVGMAAVDGKLYTNKNGHRLMSVAFIDNKQDRTIALVGKGVCFDTGGYNIKTGSMRTMKTDKLGAINVMAIGQELKKLKKAKFNFLLLCPFVENLINNGSVLPDDILEYTVDGKTLRVEIDNTDAEGRLILADGLLEAQLRDATVIIDLATLTGAAPFVFGKGVTAVLGNDKDLVNTLVEALNAVQKESAASLEIFESHRKALKAPNTDIADIVNCAPSGSGGVQTAAAFLEKFIYKKDVLWAHLDIAGSATKDHKAVDTIARGVLNFIKGLK